MYAVYINNKINIAINPISNRTKADHGQYTCSKDREKPMRFCEMNVKIDIFLMDN